MFLKADPPCTDPPKSRPRLPQHSARAADLAEKDLSLASEALPPVERSVLARTHSPTDLDRVSPVSQLIAASGRHLRDRQDGT